MQARIYRPAKTAMSSGTAKTRDWVLEYAPQSPRDVDPLMGWTGSGDMNRQVRLRFDTAEEAVAYAEANGIPFQRTDPKPRKANIRAQGYGDNFQSGRRQAWTH